MVVSHQLVYLHHLLIVSVLECLCLIGVELQALLGLVLLGLLVVALVSLGLLLRLDLIHDLMAYDPSTEGMVA